MFGNNKPQLTNLLKGINNRLKNSLNTIKLHNNKKKNCKMPPNNLGNYVVNFSRQTTMMMMMALVFVLHVFVPTLIAAVAPSHHL